MTLADGTVTSDFAAAVAELSATHPAVAGLAIVDCHGFVDSGRNLAVKQFLSTPATWLWFVDSDMVIPDGTLNRLLMFADPASHPVVSGLYARVARVSPSPGRGHSRSDRIETAVTVFDLVTTKDDAGSEVIDAPVVKSLPPSGAARVDAAGAGCLLIHRSVLERMQRLYWPMGRPGWFDRIPEHPAGTGEDVAFCMRLREMGIPLHVAVAAEVGHRKSAVFWPPAIFAVSDPKPAPTLQLQEQNA